MAYKVKGGKLRVLESQRKAFIKKFGREPGPDDPVFFDPDLPTPTKLDRDETRAATLTAMRKAGTPAHLVYAYEKTGFLVNETG
jgi:hypothetical protein